MIGVYNGAPYLAQAVDSAIAQSYRPIELIVVDDGSDDTTADVARGYGDALTYAYQPNRGNGAARNMAVTLATGDFFAFLDSDDRFVGEKLLKQHQVLTADGQVDMVFGHVREFVSPELSEEERASVRAPAPGPAPWTAPNLMLIRRTSFERVGPFSEQVRVGVTVDWFARAQEAGLRSVMLDDVVLERRLHLNNNGLRERESRNQYLHVLKAALDRRRSADSTRRARETEGG